jgi:hypothetical protein
MKFALSKREIVYECGPAWLELHGTFVTKRFVMK